MLIKIILKHSPDNNEQSCLTYETIELTIYKQQGRLVNDDFLLPQIKTQLPFYECFIKSYNLTYKSTQI